MRASLLAVAVGVVLGASIPPAAEHAQRTTELANAKGQRALELARAGGHTDVVNLLQPVTPSGPVAPFIPPPTPPQQQAPPAQPPPR